MSADESAEIAAAKKALDEGQWLEAEQLANFSLSSTPDSVGLLRILADALVRQNKPDQATAATAQILSLQPQDLQAITFLASLHWRHGRIQKAAKFCEQLVALDPNNASAENGLGLCRVGLGQWQEAAQCFRRAAELNPNSADIRHNLAGALEKTGDDDGAELAYRKALDLNGDIIPSLYNLADLLFRRANGDSAERILRRLKDKRKGELVRTGADHISEASQLLTRVLQLKLGHAEAHALLGSILQQQGFHADSQREIELALKLNPRLPVAYWRLTRTKKIDEADRSIVEAMSKLAGEMPNSSEDRMLLHNALGKALDDLGEYKASLLHFDEAHSVARQLSGPFDRQAYSGHIDATISLFDRKFLESNLDLGSASERPIFVVGMPRSGTTLVEQILSNHQDVFGGGEVAFWPGLANRAYDPKSGSLRKSHAKRLALLYLCALAQIDESSLRIVDKNPYNSMHMGLLYTLFPNTRFVYCVRHPIDNCLSIYGASFQTPPAYAHTREDLVFAYREHERLLRHWENVIPKERLLLLQYEDLVADPPSTIRRLLDFCGLKWDEECLHPERNSRLVSTASQWQVRQAIFKTSAHRWKRYEGSLGAFRELIGENTDNV